MASAMRIFAGCPIHRVFCDGWETTNLKPKASGRTAGALHIINFPWRTMVLSRAKEEDAGAKERRSKGE